jgi:uncharacterized protein (TIGR03435 family)
MRTIMVLAFVGLTSGLHAQQLPTATFSPTFEVASVKPNKSGSRSMSVRFPSSDRFEATNIDLMTLLLNAYGFQSFQIVGEPAWGRSERFDITAKADHEIAKGELQQMVRFLLADRFRLAARIEKREMPVYRLVLNKGGALGQNLVKSNIDCEELGRTKASPPTPVATQENPRPVPACSMRGMPGRLIASAMNFDHFVANIQSEVQRVVVNDTGLKGSFDVKIEWASEAAPNLSGPSYFTALQEQLGLKLESTRGPVEVLVIDHVEAPTPD